MALPGDLYKGVHSGERSLGESSFGGPTPRRLDEVLLEIDQQNDRVRGGVIGPNLDRGRRQEYGDQEKIDYHG
jgi:hypothetical protein